MESLLGLMEKVTKVNILKMKSKEKVDSTMVTDHIIKVTGLREDNMEEESLGTKTVRFTKGDMNMAN